MVFRVILWKGVNKVSDKCSRDENKMEDLKKSETGLLLQTQNEIFIRLLPVIVCIAVLGFVGIIGNILALIFYILKSKRTTTVDLIIVLSIVDFIVCVFLIPKLVEMVINIGHSQRFLCKVTQFVSLWAIAASCFLLWIIAIERHRKICKPFDKQIPIASVKYIVAGVVTFSLAVAFRNLIIYDIVGVEIPDPSINMTITGYYCTATDDPNLQTMSSSFYALDFFLILMIWITIIVAYSSAIFTLLKQRSKRKRVTRKMQPLTKCESSEMNTKHKQNTCPRGATCNDSIMRYISDNYIVSDDCTESSYGNGVDDKTNTSLDGINQSPLAFSENNRAPFAVGLSRKNGKNVRKSRVKVVKAQSVLERNLTIMMFAASVVFILSFTPFFVIRVVMRIYLGSGVDYELKTGIQFAIKLPFLNSVFNPVVYCIFNPKFRKFLKHVFCCSWR